MCDNRTLFVLRTMLRMHYAPVKWAGRDPPVPRTGSKRVPDYVQSLARGLAVLRAFDGDTRR